MRNRLFSIVVGALIVVVLVLYLFTFQVREQEAGVVLTFGKPSKPITEAGLFFQWPWPVQSVTKLDNRLRVFETKLSEMYTRDRQTVVISLAVGWRIQDPVLFIKSTGTPEQAERFVKQLVDHQTSVVGKYDLENFVSTDPGKMKFAEIEKNLTEPVSAEARREYGIEVPMVLIRRLELPEGPTAKVFARMKEERGKEATKFRAEGTGMATEIRGAADSERTQILSRAASDADRIRAEGDAEAAKYYESFNKNPELAIFLRQARALRNILAERSTVVFDVRTMPFNLFAEGGVRIPERPDAAKNPATPK